MTTERNIPQTEAVKTGLICGLVYLCLMALPRLVLQEQSGFGVLLTFVFLLFGSVPLFYAGLSKGVSSTVVACLTVSAGLMLSRGPGLFVLSHAMSDLVPVIGVVFLFLQKKDGTNRSTGDIVAGLALIWGALILVAAAAMAGTDFRESAYAFAQSTYGDMLRDTGKIPAEQINAIVQTVALIFPGMVACTWMVKTLIGGYMAEKILLKRNAALRTDFSCRDILVPSWFMPTFGVVVIAGFAMMTANESITNMSYVFYTLTLVLSFPVLCMGLALVHRTARSFSWGTAILWVFYILCLVSQWAFYAIIALGVFEYFIMKKRQLKS